LSRYLIYLISLLIPVSASSHPVDPDRIYIEFKNDGSFEINFRSNLEAKLTGITPEHEDSKESPNSRQYDHLRQVTPDHLLEKIKSFEPELRRSMNLYFDKERASLNLTKIDIPDTGDLKEGRISTLTYKGEIPSKASYASWSLARENGSNIVYMTHEGEKNRFFDWTYSGETSTSFRLNELVKKKSLTKIMTEYIVFGFEHILPRGLDHILFVLGLFLLIQSWKPLLWQITAFTLAHSVTLALTIFGYMQISPSLIEPLIAISIVYIGIENIFSRRLHWVRLLVVFLFGLLHGMGFASVLTNLGLPDYAAGTALISFNIGVELGQIAVVGSASLLTLPVQNKPWFRERIVIPASLAISSVGLFWFIQRVL